MCEVIMKLLLILSFLWPTVSYSAELGGLEGTLYKKSEKWFLFVETESAYFKKGSVALVNIPKEQNKYLIEKSYVQVIGHQEKCESANICMAVKAIKPAIYDPLKGRKK